MPLDATCLPTPATGALRRIGTLAARGWRAKLYAPAMEAAGLQPEDLAAAGRVFHAGIAAPGTAAVAGFALLRPGAMPGSLVLSAHWWEGDALHRTVRLLPGCGGPPLRPDDADRVGDVDEVLLMAREAVAWRRCVGEADRPSLDAYLAECCA